MLQKSDIAKPWFNSTENRYPQTMVYLGKKNIPNHINFLSMPQSNMAASLEGIDPPVQNKWWQTEKYHVDASTNAYMVRIKTICFLHFWRRRQPNLWRDLLKTQSDKWTIWPMESTNTCSAYHMIQPEWQSVTHWYRILGFKFSAPKHPTNGWQYIR